MLQEKEQRNIYLKVLSFFILDLNSILHQLKNGINLRNRHQILNREGEKGPYLSCSCDSG